MGKLADAVSANIVKTAMGYQYSNVAIEKLIDNATGYTLGSLLIDVTGSLGGREKDLENIMRQIVIKLKSEPTAASIQWRVNTFANGHTNEIHGFKLLQDIDPVADYNIGNCYGGTNLFKACSEVINTTQHEAERLWDQELDVNAISVFITDGDNNMGGSAADVKELVNNSMRSEKIDSYRTILVGVNNAGGSWKDRVSQKLKEFQDDAEITEYVDLGDFDDAAIKRIILQVSSITSDTSKIINSGGPSQMTF